MRSGNLPNLGIIKSSPDFLQKWEFPAHGISVLPATLAICIRQSGKPHRPFIFFWTLTKAERRPWSRLQQAKQPASLLVISVSFNSKTTVSRQQQGEIHTHDIEAASAP